MTWDREPDGEAATARDAARIASAVAGNVRPGSIAPLHVRFAANASLARQCRSSSIGVQATGCRFVTVGELRDTRRTGAR